MRLDIRGVNILVTETMQKAVEHRLNLAEGSTSGITNKLLNKSSSA